MGKKEHSCGFICGSWLAVVLYKNTGGSPCITLVIQWSADRTLCVDLADVFSSRLAPQKGLTQKLNFLDVLLHMSRSKCLVRCGGGAIRPVINAARFSWLHQPFSSRGSRTPWTVIEESSLRFRSRSLWQKDSNNTVKCGGEWFQLNFRAVFINKRAGKNLPVGFLPILQGCSEIILAYGLSGKICCSCLRTAVRDRSESIRLWVRDWETFSSQLHPYLVTLNKLHQLSCFCLLMLQNPPTWKPFFEFVYLIKAELI